MTEFDGLHGYQDTGFRYALQRKEYLCEQNILINYAGAEIKTA